MTPTPLPHSGLLKALATPAASSGAFGKPAPKCRPSLMCGPMVRACLHDKSPKTQTRRVVKPQPTFDYLCHANGNKYGCMSGTGESTGWIVYPDQPWIISHFANRHAPTVCTYGVPGDVLFVRESLVAKECAYGRKCAYAADGLFVRGPVVKSGDCEHTEAPAWKWQKSSIPSIHMPRWACRLYLEVVSVRVERVQDISEADAVAEGCDPLPVTEADVREIISDRRNSDDVRNLARVLGPGQFTAKYAYSLLWDSINGAGSWASNPWVWRVEFKRTEGSIPLASEGK